MLRDSHHCRTIFSAYCDNGRYGSLPSRAFAWRGSMRWSNKERSCFYYKQNDPHPLTIPGGSQARTPPGLHTAWPRLHAQGPACRTLPDARHTHRLTHVHTLGHTRRTHSTHPYHHHHHTAPYTSHKHKFTHMATQGHPRTTHTVTHATHTAPHTHQVHRARLCIQGFLCASHCQHYGLPRSPPQDREARLRHK